ncbi:cell division topological specificity factor MinE [Myxosarcina sp. GI1(2024)]
MIAELLKMLFPWKNNTNSRNNAKNRLKLIIAHDRASINPEMMTSMREEILEVVARYVDVDREEMEFTLSNDRRTTALTANLPIRQVKRPEMVSTQVEDLEKQVPSTESSPGDNNSNYDNSGTNQ